LLPKPYRPVLPAGGSGSEGISGPSLVMTGLAKTKRSVLFAAHRMDLQFATLVLTPTERMHSAYPGVISSLLVGLGSSNNVSTVYYVYNSRVTLSNDFFLRGESNAQLLLGLQIPWATSETGGQIGVRQERADVPRTLFCQPRVERFVYSGASITQISKLPSRSESKAIFFPSGLQAGNKSQAKL